MTLNLRQILDIKSTKQYFSINILMKFAHYISATSFISQVIIWFM